MSDDLRKTRPWPEVESATPPDSGEHEVRSHTAIVGWPTIRKLAGEGTVMFPEQGVALVAADDLFNGPYPLPGDVFLPLSLAQRILAALEEDDKHFGARGKVILSDERAALADELWKVLP